jgi:hypothetical protein
VIAPPGKHPQEAESATALPGCAGQPNAAEACVHQLSFEAARAIGSAPQQWPGTHARSALSKRREPGESISGIGRFARTDEALRYPDGSGQHLARCGERQACLPAGAVGLRQDDRAAACGWLPRADGGRDRVGGPHRLKPQANTAARATQRVHGVPELRSVAAHDGGAERRLWSRAAQAAARGHCQESGGHPRHHAADASGPTLSCRTVGWSAAARIPRPRADRGARHPIARRASFQP